MIQALKPASSTVMALAAGLLCVTESATADSADAGADLAKKLANPMASLISVPFQYNYDDNYRGDDEGSQHLLNIQPVAPFSLNENWNVITRTIVLLAEIDNIPTGSSASGLGDIMARQFFSPKEPTAGGLIWGAGPVELLPTASDETLGRFAGKRP